MTIEATSARPRDPSLLGSAFITLVEPDPGYEAEYDRWYAEDHFYVGAMALPYWFAGKRWFASPDLKEHRQQEQHAIEGDPDDGTFLATYWILQGRFEEQLQALRQTVEELFADSRMFPRRRHVHTLFYDRVAGVRRRRNGPLDLQALDAEYQGVVMEFVEVDDPADRPVLLDALIDCLPAQLEQSGFDLAVVLTPREWPANVDLWFDYGSVKDNRVLVLWFLTVEPSTVTDAFDRGRAQLCPIGRSTYVAPFRSLVPGRQP
jgi:hypothetical protein